MCLRLSWQFRKGLSDLVRSSTSGPDAEAATGQLRIELPECEEVAVDLNWKNAGLIQTPDKRNFKSINAGGQSSRLQTHAGPILRFVHSV